MRVHVVRSVRSSSSEGKVPRHALCTSFAVCECAMCLEESAILGLGGLELGAIGMNALVNAAGRVRKQLHTSTNSASNPPSLFPFSTASPSPISTLVQSLMSPTSTFLTASSNLATLPPGAPPYPSCQAPLSSPPQQPQSPSPSSSRQRQPSQRQCQAPLPASSPLPALNPLPHPQNAPNPLRLRPTRVSGSPFARGICTLRTRTCRRLLQPSRGFLAGARSKPVRAAVSDWVGEKEGEGTLMIRPCTMRKLGLLMLSCTLCNRVWIACCWDLRPWKRYFEIFGSTICKAIQLVRVMLEQGRGRAAGE
jgi:hypothetical protein